MENKTKEKVETYRVFLVERSFSGEKVMTLHSTIEKCNNFNLSSKVLSEVKEFFVEKDVYEDLLFNEKYQITCGVNKDYIDETMKKQAFYSRFVKN